MNVVYLPALGWKGNPNMAKYIITQGSVKLAWDFSKKKYTSALRGNSMYLSFEMRTRTLRPGSF